MISPFSRAFGADGLSQDDIAFLDRTLKPGIRRFEAGEDLVRRGDRPTHAYLILDGWTYRYKFLPNHRRQIIAYLLQGDLSDLFMFVTPTTDHSIAGLTNVTAAEVPLDVFQTTFGGHYPRIARAMWTKMLVAASIQREWAVNLGQRSAPERIGHILCEMFHRLRAAGLTDGTQCAFPLTQTDLAEATGLSLVHVNKRLRDLRTAGLIELRGKILTIPDLVALENASLFRADYLSIHNEPDLEIAQPSKVSHLSLV